MLCGDVVGRGREMQRGTLLFKHLHLSYGLLEKPMMFDREGGGFKRVFYLTYV